MSLQKNALASFANIKKAIDSGNTVDTSSGNYSLLLNAMCLAPANLRYGLTLTNNAIDASLDPMGDENGKITAQEKWFRTTGNLTWGSATTCTTTGTTRVPCRPSSTGLYVQTPGIVTRYTICDANESHC